MTMDHDEDWAKDYPIDFKSKAPFVWFSGDVGLIEEYLLSTPCFFEIREVEGGFVGKLFYHSLFSKFLPTPESFAPIMKKICTLMAQKDEIGQFGVEDPNGEIYEMEIGVYGEDDVRVWRVWRQHD